MKKRAPYLDVLHIANTRRNTKIPVRGVLQINFTSFGFFKVFTKFYSTWKIIRFIQDL